MTIAKSEELKELYEEMSRLTKEQCLKDCTTLSGNIGSCCDKMYCEIALENAEKVGVPLIRREGNLPALGSDGCIVPPYLRPMCTMHVCDKSLRGGSFFKSYFELRDKINAMEEVLYAGKFSSLVS